MTKREIMAGVTRYSDASLVARNTVQYLCDSGRTRVVRLYTTDVITERTLTSAPWKSVTLSSGGWRSVTTKDRINRFSGLNGAVVQRGGAWYYHDMASGVSWPFLEGMVILGGTPVVTSIPMTYGSLMPG